MITAKYVVGIDLGTTNSVVAWAPLDAEDVPAIELLPIPQLVDVGTVESRSSLPSFIFLPPDADSGDVALSLPWSGETSVVVGELARRQAAEFPDRTIGAVKSWLAYRGVDRHQSILPWGAGQGIPKLSPVAASQLYLEHLIAAWNHHFPQHPLAQQQIVLTVPASFDASARELTREAAVAAGLPSTLVLLEEPQAAVYAWLNDHCDRWRKQLRADDRILVCDIGGGTSDLTLIGVADQDGELTLQRIAVGDHLLVGGDNMDLAIAHYVAGQFQAQGIQLDPWQSISLWHSCRTAKESLLAADGPERHTISVLGRGSRLVGGTVSVEVERQRIAELLADGFMPNCGLDEKPESRRQSGFQQLGLPYETDAAITRHIASFLNRHSAEDSTVVQPTRLLLNGGVFQAAMLRGRLVSVLEGWFDQPIHQLAPVASDLNNAVARGAAYYGWAKHRGGVRIRGGTARSYYIGVESAGLAIPGAARPLQALCVVPFGMEEGTQINVPSAEIGLVLGEKAHFRFFSSSVRKHDLPGSVLMSWSSDELQETDSLEAELTRPDDVADVYVPVRFQSHVTEIGVLELWCAGTRSENRWKLEFNVRGEDGAS